jgi:YidC/Oxa1 family membrane protein insertase
MQKMQPKMKEIREKYADDPQRQREETMKVYGETKFSPLSGCLPMLLQMPIFLALFQVLNELNDRVQGEKLLSFYNLIPDISKAPGAVFAPSLEGVIAVIPYVLLMLLFGFSILIPTIINKTADKQTRIMTGIMAIVFVVFGWNTPAGVLLYWDLSSLIGVGQQMVTMHFMKKKDEEQEALVIKPVVVDVDRKETKPKPTKKKKK